MRNAQDIRTKEEWNFGMSRQDAWAKNISNTWKAIGGWKETA